MRGLNDLVAEWERRAGRAIEGGELVGKKLTRHARERLPDKQGARIGMGGADGRHECREDLQRASSRHLLARGFQLPRDLQTRPSDDARGDER